jgi:hypothetical protein
MRKGFIFGLAVFSGIVLSPLKSLAASPVYIVAEEGSVFLGCVNCGKYDDSSLNNKYSTYVNRYEQESI